MKRLVILVLALFLFSFAEPSSTGGAFASLSNLKEDLDNGQKTSLNQSIQIERAVDSSYIVGPGDYFDLYMEANSLTLQVSPDGFVGLERAGLVPVAGVPLPEAIKRIKAALAKIYLDKECFVKLAQMKQARIGVYGAVNNPGQQLLPAGVRLSAVFRQMGGVYSMANLDSVLLIRNGDTTVLRYMQAELNGSLNDDPLLVQGDLVIVPEYQKSAKLVFVRVGDQGRTLPWKEGQTADVYLERTRMMQKTNKAFTQLNLQNATTKSIRSFPISELNQVVPQPNEILEPVQDVGLVHIGGAVIRLGSMPYNPDWTPYEYVANSGVAYYTQGYGSFRVIHKDGKDEWIDPAKGKIEPGDYIEIPRSGYEQAKDVTLFLASIIGILSTSILVYITAKTAK